jgi:transposase-like protein
MVTLEKDDLRNPECPRCRRPMRVIGGMAQTTNLPRLDSYRCEACNEVCVLEDRSADK